MGQSLRNVYSPLTTSHAHLFVVGQSNENMEATLILGDFDFKKAHLMNFSHIMIRFCDVASKYC